MNKKEKKIMDEMKERIKAIEEFVTAKNPTQVFDSMLFLIGLAKMLDAALEQASQQLQMLKGQLQFYAIFIKERGLEKDFMEWKADFIKKNAPPQQPPQQPPEKPEESTEETPEEDVDKKLEEQKKKLEELKDGN